MATAKASPEELIAQIRLKALTEVPALLGNDSRLKHVATLGVMMESGLDDLAITLVALADGTVSVYFSGGGAVIGGGEHEHIRVAAHRFIQFAGMHLDEMRKCSRFPLPMANETRFYVLTREGTFCAHGMSEDLAADTHPLSVLFCVGQRLLEQMRLISENHDSDQV